MAATKALPQLTYQLENRKDIVSVETRARDVENYDTIAARRPLNPPSRPRFDVPEKARRNGF